MRLCLIQFYYDRHDYISTALVTGFIRGNGYELSLVREVGFGPFGGTSGMNRYSSDTGDTAGSFYPTYHLQNFAKYSTHSGFLGCLSVLLSVLLSVQQLSCLQHN